MFAFASPLQTALLLALLASVMLFFRPLLVGIVRALVLLVRPRQQKRGGR